MGSFLRQFIWDLFKDKLTDFGKKCMKKLSTIKDVIF